MRLNYNKTRFKIVSILSISIFAVVVSLGCLLYSFGLRFNLTASLPLGIWKIDTSFSQIYKGDYFWFKPTKEIADFGIERGYLEKNPRCENNSIPLLKIVYGIPGDTYSFHDDSVRINNQSIENVKRRKKDTQDRLMPIISNGIVREKHLFVLTLHPHSYDSPILWYDSISKHRRDCKATY